MSFKELGNGLEETSASISDASVANLVRWHMNMLSGKDKKPDLPGRAWGWARPPSSRRFHCRSDENPAPGRRGAAGGPGQARIGEDPLAHAFAEKVTVHAGMVGEPVEEGRSRPDERDFFRAAHGTCGALRAFPLLCK